LLARVDPRAWELLLKSAGFREKFFSNEERNAFVVSIDIRRSTELMLKARTPALFAEFISHLCLDLIDIIKRNFGVFDKFTGDGILAFFPEFFSGQDAGIHAVTAALRCHAAFEAHYTRSRGCFSSVLLDTGLGIGIDYGATRVLQMADGLTVVGQPVVYACRMGAAPAGKTYINQPAYEKIRDGSKGTFHFSDERLEIKHEGLLLAYSVRSTGSEPEPRMPDWLPKSALESQESQVTNEGLASDATT